MSEDVLDDILDDSNEGTKEEVKKEDKKAEQPQPAKNKDADEFKPGVGVDVGTSNIVVARQRKDGTFVNRFHRDMLYPLDVSDESADLLERSDYLYVKVGDRYYIVGEDALRLVNAIGKGEVVRPMQDGILNPTLKESSELLFYVIKAVVGDPIIENEPLRFSIPANPVDRDLDNLFHKMVLDNFFNKLGYDSKAVNEAMALGYDSNPVTKNDDGDAQLSGICCSFGGGMINVALMFKGLELNSFSITKSGDYIDQSASKVTGIAESKIIKIKEKELDLNNLDMSDRVKAALSIYYEEMLNRVIDLISKEFIDRKSEADGELEVVVAGGTSMAPGFCDHFTRLIKQSDIPFKISNVRHASEPFYAVSQGACIRAQADYSKLNK